VVTTPGPLRGGDCIGSRIGDQRRPTLPLVRGERAKIFPPWWLQKCLRCLVGVFRRQLESEVGFVVVSSEQVESRPVELDLGLAFPVIVVQQRERPIQRLTCVFDVFLPKPAVRYDPFGGLERIGCLSEGCASHGDEVGLDGRQIGALGRQESVEYLYGVRDARWRDGGQRRDDQAPAAEERDQRIA